jgi:hypothetical protein
MSAGHRHAVEERHASQSDWLCRWAWFKMAMAHQPSVPAQRLGVALAKFRVCS